MSQRPFSRKGKAAPRETVLSVGEPDEGRGLPIRNETITMISAPRSQISEQFRALRNAISALNPDGAPRTVCITSSLRGEGKTLAAINLGIAMTEVPGKHVLLIDANLHTPAIEETLGLPRRQGLVELLRGTLPLDKAIRETSIDGLHVLGSGTQPENTSQLLGSERLRTLLHSLKQRYSYVLIDTPEALATNDAGLIGSMSDGIVLVVRLGETPRYYAEQTANMLESLGGNLLGTCLTGASVQGLG